MVKTFAWLIAASLMVMFYIGFHALSGSFYIHQTVFWLLFFASYFPLSTLFIAKDIQSHQRLKAERVAAQSNYPATMNADSLSYGSHTASGVLSKALLASFFAAALFGSVLFVALYGVASTLHANDVGNVEYQTETFTLSAFECDAATAMSSICSADIKPSFSGDNRVYLSEIASHHVVDAHYRLNIKRTWWGTSIAGIDGHP
uniref:hypothetical protein n=1 Tax=Thaumasiovibrio occultus TaxID=1891184 RepID=UPI000B34DB2B|nr:hypothetical protein [Thaumasiovibrio occultus]